MSGHREKRSKRQHEPLDVHMADDDEGDSSQLNVVSGRQMRSRKRSTADDVIEKSDGSSSSDDEVEDETYRVEHRAGKGPVQQESSEDAEDEEEESENDDVEGGGDAPIITKPRYPFGRAPTNYFGDGMTETVKRLRRENPYAEARNAIDPRFWSTFLQDFYTTVILKKSKITHEAQYVDWEYMARKNNVVFDEVIAACEDKRIKHLIGFKHSWNKEMVKELCSR